MSEFVWQIYLHCDLDLRTLLVNFGRIISEVKLNRQLTEIENSEEQLT